MKNTFELVHVGINNNSHEESTQLANLLCTLFNLTPRHGGKSEFAGNYFECMNMPFLGTHGHIAMQTEDLEAAVEELKEKGVSFTPPAQKELRKLCGGVPPGYVERQVLGIAQMPLENKVNIQGRGPDDAITEEDKANIEQQIMIVDDIAALTAEQIEDCSVVAWTAGDSYYVASVYRWQDKAEVVEILQRIR